MSIPKIFNIKYKQLPSSQVSLGYTTITIYPLAEINNFIKDNWLIIGNEDLCGDLICIDTKIGTLPVYLVPLTDELEPDYIASSFDNFADILKVLVSISINRESPMRLEKNQVPKSVKDDFLNNIKEKNPNCDIHFWENIFEI